MMAERPDTSGTHVWLVLMKAWRTLGRHAEKSFAAMELGFSDFTILEALLHKGPQLVNDLGRRINLTSGSITTAVDRLEERGLVERVEDENDRRARIVSLTNKGRTLIEKAFAGHRERMDAAAGALKKNERAMLIELLKKLGLGAEAMLAEEETSQRRRGRRVR
jgi:MarR family transcriptional regulator, 2-MHQ and catechol-resistance regulon repressor